MSTIHHVRAGGTADFPLYFLGEVSMAGWLSYFPVVYALREPRAFLPLTAVALCLAFPRIWSSPWGLWLILSWLRSHPAETIMLSWFALYWGWRSPLI